MVTNIGSTGFRMQHFTIRELMERIHSNQLYIDVNIDREWNKEKQIYFIESILCGIPIASIYLNGSRPQWHVLDGIERINAIQRYVEGRLTLRNLELLSDMYERNFLELPSQIKRRFLNTSVWGHVLTIELPENVLNSVYRRLNQMN